MCVALASVVGLCAGAWAQSDPLCPWLVDCQYEAPGFSIRVVDQQTGQPLAGVHALATWLMYGGHGGRRPLMVLEAVSGPDGMISFPAWGPVRSGASGLEPARDPLISLFRPGYHALLVHNHTPLGQRDTVLVHAFQQAGQTFELVPFQGTPAETLAELWKAVDPFEGANVSRFDSSSMRQAYVNRLRRVKAEAERLPRHLPALEHLLWAIDGGIRLFESGGG
jgi:hypothetical protein